MSGYKLAASLKEHEDDVSGQFDGQTTVPFMALTLLQGPRSCVSRSKHHSVSIERCDSPNMEAPISETGQIRLYNIITWFLFHQRRYLPPPYEALP